MNNFIFIWKAITCPSLRIKDHPAWTTTCKDIDDQIQKLKIIILNVFIQQPAIQFIRLWIYWIDIDLLFQINIVVWYTYLWSYLHFCHKNFILFFNFCDFTL